MKFLVLCCATFLSRNQQALVDSFAGQPLLSLRRTSSSRNSFPTTSQSAARASDNHVKAESAVSSSSPVNRRGFAQRSCVAAIAWMVPTLAVQIHPASASVESLVSDLQQARTQMNGIPELIRAEQWDGVRAILVKPPLSDLWTKSARKQPLLMEYAEAVGDNPAGDELAVLESKEELQSHLRYLDMAVYNNVFNPIRTEGENGATKELIRSYREDPTNEFKASIVALDELIQLGNLK